jgi:putative hydrolase of the HAD superfamily
MTERITTLFCDIGGVLLTNGWDRGGRRKAAEQFHLDPAAMDERHHFVFDTYEEGKTTLDDYLQHVVFYEPRTFSLAAFKAFMFDRSQALPDMLEFLQRLKARHRLKIFALSNEGRELTLYRVRTFRLDTLMDAFVCSCFVHVRKPDPEIYRIALDLAQAAPETVVYLEDRAMFAQIGSEQGLHALLHTDYDSTRTTLAALGLTLP